MIVKKTLFIQSKLQKDKEICPSGCSNENIENQENTIVKPAPTPTLSTTKAEYFYNKREKKL